MMPEIKISGVDELGRVRRFPWLIVCILLIVVTLWGLIQLFSSCSAEGDGGGADAAEEKTTNNPEEISGENSNSEDTPTGDNSGAGAVGDPALFRSSFLKGDEAEKAGELSIAREYYLKALSLSGPGAEQLKVEERIAGVTLPLLTTPRQMKEKVTYIIQSGDHLSSIARRFGTTLELVQVSNEISNPNMIRKGDNLRILNKVEFTIKVRKKENDLVLEMNGEFVKRYSVGTGRYGKTPVGNFTIVDRIKEPIWWRSDGREIPYGDPENILGTRWLKLQASEGTSASEGYGIHGTWDDSTIGRQSSAGCIRMRNIDVEQLYMLVPLHTAVNIAE